MPWTIPFHWAGFQRKGSPAFIPKAVAMQLGLVPTVVVPEPDMPLDVWMGINVVLREERSNLIQICQGVSYSNELAISPCSCIDRISE